MEDKEKVKERVRRYRERKSQEKKVSGIVNPKLAPISTAVNPVLLGLIGDLEKRMSALESRMEVLESHESVSPVVDRIMTHKRGDTADDLFRRVMLAKEKRLGVR